MAIKIPHNVKASATPVALPTVDDVFDGWGLPAEISAALYDASPSQLAIIGRWLGTTAGQEAVYSLKQPTPSALAAEAKKLSSGLWEYVAGTVGVDEHDGALKKRITIEFRDAFDRAAHKMLTGHELPQAKDGFSQNALAGIRQVTGHGDAALLLYRIRYWWRKASIVHFGKLWIAKTHKQWATELGMKPRTFRTAYDRLVTLGLIETMTAEFKGYPMTHLRPTPKAESLFKTSNDNIAQ